MGELGSVDVEAELRHRFVSTRRIPKNHAAEIADIFGGALHALLDGAVTARHAAALWALLPRLLLGAVADPRAPPRDRGAPRQGAMRRVLKGRLHRFHAGAWRTLLEEGREGFPASPLAQLPEEGGVPGWQRARDRVRFARSGQLSKAAGRLTSPGVAPWAPEVEDTLQDMVSPPGTAASPPSRQGLAPDVQVRLDPILFRRRLRRAPRGSAPGPTGLRTDHLHCLLASPACLDLLRCVCGPVLSGQLEELADFLAYTVLVPLAKGRGGVRPLALPDAVRRLAASVLCAQLKDTLAAALYPDTLAVGTPGAAEVAAKLVQTHGDRHRSWAYVKNDGTNAYCEMPRAAALLDVAAASPELGQACAVWYTRESRFLVYRPNGQAAVLRSSSGWEQGDPLAPAGYSLGSLRALRAARERIRELVNDLSGPAAAADVLLVAYLDDVLLGVPAEACAEALRILHEELAAVRHFRSWGKLEIWSPAGIQPPGLPSEAATAWRPEGLTVLGLPLPASPSSRRGPSEPGGEDAGLAEEWLDAAAASAGPAAAAGSERFIESFARARVQAAEHLADLVVRAVDEGEAGDPTAQVAGLLLRLCVLPRVLHLFRGHYARSLLPLASEFDDMMRTMAARVWRTSPNWRRKVELQVRLPLRWGGMGLRPIAEVAPAAYLGSWAQVLPLVQGALGGAPLLGPEAPPSSTASTVQDAVRRWQELAGRPGVEPVD